MIDVPVEVKEALREGSYKKNYEFEVYREETIRHIVNVGSFDNSHTSFSVTEEARYILYNTEDTHPFAYYEVIGETARSEICPVGETETWLDIGTCYPGDTITIYGLSAVSVGITITTNVTYTKEWAYDFTMDNDNLVKESVSIDERLCSGDTLKFGLCEGSSLEFQYFGKRNIKGDRIKASVEVNHLQYAEGDVYIEVGNTLSDGNSYKVKEDGTYYRVIVPANSPLVRVSFLRYRGNTYTDVPTSAQDTIIESPEMLKNDVITASTQGQNSQYIALSVEKKTRGRVPTGYTMWTTIPMGYFTVEKCSRQASTGIIKATCYNKLQSDYLDAKANLLLEKTYSNNGESILVYDIQKTLLEDYQIEADHTSVTPKAGIGFNVLGFTLNIPFYFTALYGLRTPLSAYQYNSIVTPSLSTPLYIRFEATGLKYTIDDDVYWSFYKNYGDIEVFERNVYDRIKYIFDSAVLKTTSTISPFNNGTVTGQMFCDWVCKNVTGGFSTVFGASIIQDNVTQTYSTIQWEYEEANNIAHTVAGTIKDFIEITRHGAAEVRIQLPDALQGVTSTSLNPGVFADITFGELAYFYWWTDSYMHNTEALRLYPIKYANGEDYAATNSSNNFSDAIECGTLTLSKADAVEVDPYNLPEFTLRDIVSASYETQCQFGQLDRETDLFSGVELGSDVSEAFTPSQYETLWADEQNVRKWRYLIITYKGLDGDGNEAEFTLQRTINADGTDDYNCSDNWLFRNLIWTAQQLGPYASAMVDKMRDITWFPFEMWAAGLPYLETGDKVEMTVGEEDYTSYILQRQLKGIQNLQDTYINGTLDIY